MGKIKTVSIGKDEYILPREVEVEESDMEDFLSELDIREEYIAKKIIKFILTILCEKKVK